MSRDFAQVELPLNRLKGQAKPRLLRLAAGSFACALLCLSVVLAPVAIGGTTPQAIVTLDVVMAIAICLVISFQRPRISLLLFPIVCLGAAAAQLMPLPESLLLFIAPVSTGLWRVANTGLHGASACISIAPAETAASARRLLLAIGTVAVVDVLAARPHWRRSLVASLASSGLIIWVLGLLFPAKDNSYRLLGWIDIRGPLMDGRTPLESPVATASFGFPEIVTVVGQEYAADSWAVGDCFGPYLISNHFAGAITLTVPFIAAAWLVVGRQRVPWWLGYLGVFGLFAGVIATLGGSVQSRAGTASFVMAALVFQCMMAPPGVWRRASIAVTLTYGVLIACLLVTLFGPFHGVENYCPPAVRAPLVAILNDDRVLYTHVAWRMFLASPVLGTGLGTYGILYPSMVRDGSALYFAHNEYAQLLAEAGLVGLVLLGVALVLVVQAASRFWRQADGEDRLVGAAAWSAVAGMATHSCFDWNLRVPANVMLTCVVAGLAIASGPPATAITPEGDAKRAATRLLVASLLLLVLTAAGYLVRDAVSEFAQRRLRQAIVAARLHDSDPSRPLPKEELLKAISAGKKIAQWDPLDARLATSLGQAYLHLASCPIPIDDANDCIDTAEVWFLRARRNSAACRGLAQPRVLMPTP